MADERVVGEIDEALADEATEATEVAGGDATGEADGADEAIDEAIDEAVGEVDGDVEASWGGEVDGDAVTPDDGAEADDDAMAPSDGAGAAHMSSSVKGRLAGEVDKDDSKAFGKGRHMRRAPAPDLPADDGEGDDAAPANPGLAVPAIPAAVRDEAPVPEVTDAPTAPPVTPAVTPAAGEGAGEGPDAGGDGDGDAGADAPAADLLTEYQEQLERVLGHQAPQPEGTGDDQPDADPHAEATPVPNPQVVEARRHFGPSWLGALGIAVAAAVAGYAGAGGLSAPAATEPLPVVAGAPTTIGEAGLDATVATVSHAGRTFDVTVRDVLMRTSSVESSLNDAGTYDLPTTELVVSAARTMLLADEAAARGAIATDEDVSAYASETFGSDDVDELSEAYGMDGEAIRLLLRESADIDALRRTVVEGDDPVMPDSPDTPAAGKEKTATKGYADYVIALAGDEWDAEKGTWADPDGEWAEALGEGSGFTARSATPEAAYVAYDVAYGRYVDEYAEHNAAWSELMAQIAASSTIEIRTLG